MNTCVGRDHVAHLIVFEANHRVGNVVETGQGFARLGVAATNRASFYLYTVREEIDQLVHGIRKAQRIFA